MSWFDNEEVQEDLPEEVQEDLAEDTEEEVVVVPFDDGWSTSSHPQEDEEYLVCPVCGSPYCGGCD